MPHTVEYLEKIGIIRIESDSESGIDEWKRSREKVMRIHRETAAALVLFDVRHLRVTPNTLDLFNFAAELPLAIRFAIVVSNSNRDDLGFVETVGRNRGKSVRAFQGYEQAIAWLSTRA